MEQSKPIVRYLDTTTAYDLWSEVYDTDGNFLQALDTIEMKELFPKFSNLLKDQSSKIVDLGCGTGRNTTTLLSIPNTTIIALDASPKMLDIAKSRIESISKSKSISIHFDIVDLIHTSKPPDITLNSDGIISTLVIEHIPTNIYFNHISQMLKPGGILLLTNMHSEMGNISQAGFIDPKTGEKIRPKSYAHTVEEVINEAKKYDLELIGKMEEKSIDETMISQLGERSKKWIGIKVWYGGIFKKS